MLERAGALCRFPNCPMLSALGFDFRRPCLPFGNSTIRDVPLAPDAKLESRPNVSWEYGPTWQAGALGSRSG
jgi:hypothetical protein